MAFLHYRGDGEPQFAHPKERELAELLDTHGIAWEYEPHTFPLDHHPDGTVSEAITPDFYLPEIGAYVECTAMKQPNTRRKRKKVRKVSRIYGEVVTLLCRRDLQRLRGRYGRGA